MKLAMTWLGRNGALAIGFLALLAGSGGVAVAQGGYAPEIDAGSMANALVVLSGALLIVKGRRPRK